MFGSSAGDPASTGEWFDQHYDCPGSASFVTLIYSTRSSVGDRTYYRLTSIPEFAVGSWGCEQHGLSAPSLGNFSWRRQKR